MTFTFFRSARFYEALAVVLIGAVFCFHLFTLSRGSTWGDDWAMYVNHAYNLSHGRPYAFPGYIFNPMYPTYAPTAYPAGYPLLLTPVTAIWGLELRPIKVMNLLVLAAGLYWCWMWLRGRLHPALALTAVVMLGVAPFFWQMRDQMLSDVPHMAFSVLFFVGYDRWRSRESVNWKWAVLLGMALFYVYALRSIGLVLIGAFALHLVFEPAARRKSGAIVMATAVVLWAVHNALVPSDSYYKMLSLSASPRIVDQVYSGLRPYVAEIGEFLRIHDDNSVSAFGYIFTAFLTVFMLAGLMRVRRWTLLETYICLYLLAIAFFPGYQGFRYLVGIFPFLLYYAFSFAENLPVRPLRYVVGALLLVMFFAHTVSWYGHNRKKPIIGDIVEEGPQRFMAFIRDSIPANAVIVADRPRIIALYTDRRGTVYPDQRYEGEWLGWLDRNNVTYAMKAAWDNDKPDRYWARYMDAHPEHFEKIYEHSGLQVYRYRRPAAPQ